MDKLQTTKINEFLRNAPSLKTIADLDGSAKSIESAKEALAAMAGVQEKLAALGSSSQVFEEFTRDLAASMRDVDESLRNPASLEWAKREVELVEPLLDSLKSVKTVLAELREANEQIAKAQSELLAQEVLLTTARATIAEMQLQIQGQEETIRKLAL